MKLQKVEWQGQVAYTVEDGRQMIWLWPEVGARLCRWMVDGREMLFWPESVEGLPPERIRGGNPILFPVIARHFVNGKPGRWRDKDGTIREMPMHGFARGSAFTVETEGDVVWMVLNDSEATHRMYPWAFRFRVGYLLVDDGLEARLETTNLGDRPMPYCAGHHFYFPVPHASRGSWTLTLKSGRWARQRPDGSIRTEPSLGERFRLSDYELVDRFHLELKDRPVILAEEGTGRGVRFDLGGSQVPWYAVTTWTQQAGSDFYCVEPWTGLPNAIHHGMGLRWLAPGQTETARCRLVALGP